jgi:hypothetical protein
MIKNRRALFLIVLLVTGGLIFFYRYSLINTIQQRLIKSIADRATVANRTLLRDPAFSHHHLFGLKGTERLWPHRVNSLQRFRYLYGEFAGFECDIQFDPNTGALAIGHDSPGPESLTGYLDADTGQKKLFWLDLKNIDSGNAASFSARLQTLHRQYSLRDRIILECYDTTAARSLGEQGWLTALNVNALKALDATALPAPPDRPVRLPKNIILLSGESAIHPAIAREYPGLKQLNWDIGFRDGMDRATLLRQANDTGLLVCLIDVKSPGYR